jgi:protein TonB
MPRTEQSNASVTPPLTPANDARRLIAATRDVALGRALQALAEDISIVIVDDVRKLTDEMLRQGSNLALVDAAVVDQPLEGVVDALTAQFPDLRLMVAGQASEQSLLASRLANETVFRFVNKPASPQRLKLFLEAAARQSGPRRDPQLANATPTPPSKMGFIIAGLVAVAVAAAAAFIFWPKGAAARLNARDLGRVEEMLRQADTALRSGRFVAFDGSSAAELYRDVLRLDEQNEPARTGFDKAVDGAITGAQKMLGDAKLDEARNSMEAVRLLAPQNAGLAQLITQIDAETNRQLADAKARQAMAERQAQIKAAVEKMSARIRDGALLDPATDNATVHFTAAQDISAGDPAVRTARSELTTALVAAGEKAVSAQRLAEARRYATATGRINSSAQGLDRLVLHIEQASAPTADARRPASAPAVNATAPPVNTAPPPAAPAPAPVAVAPEPVAAAPEPVAATPTPAAQPEWIPGEGVVRAGKLTAVRTVEPEFPNDAQQSMTSGWVEMEYTVARDGAVKDIKVTGSEPRRVFDNAAINALRRYRYKPVLKDGQAVEQRARIRMGFKAAEK